MTADLLDEAEQRAITLSKAGAGKHLFLDYAHQAVMLVLLEVLAEGYTDLELRLQAADREKAEMRQEADRHRLQIMAIQSALASIKADIAELKSADARKHPE